MPADSRGPGILVPPPLVFVGGWLIGLWLNTRLEFLIDGAGPGPVQSALGGLAMVAGLGLMAWGVVTFVVARTAVYPNQAARALVRRGPYKFTRNPMYLGLTLAYVGAALVANLVWPVVLLPVVILVMTTMIIRREEAHLRSAFGADYDAYCAEVRRWV